MTFRPLLCAAALLSLAFAPAALAQDGYGYDQNDPNYLSVSAGYYDILDDDGAADFRVEYRAGHKYLWVVKPWAGVEFTTDGSIWAGGGVLADIKLERNWYLVPNFGVGLYTEGSSDKDLDYPIQFRSQLEVAYQFEDASRAGLAFGHISNASLGDDNPGTEILSLYYHLPVGSLF